MPLADSRHTEVPEVIGAFLSTKQRNEGANCSEESRDNPRGKLVQQRFEFAVMTSGEYFGR